MNTILTINLGITISISEANIQFEFKADSLSCIGVSQTLAATFIIFVINMINAQNKYND